MSGERARENNLWSWLKNAEKTLGEEYRRLHWRRIENSAGVGDPDVEGCFWGACFCIELKSVPRTAQINCELKPNQAMWLRARAMAGGAAFVLVQVGINHDARRYLISAVNCTELLSAISEERLKELALISPTCKPRDVLNHVSLRREHD